MEPRCLDVLFHQVKRINSCIMMTFPTRPTLLVTAPVCLMMPLICCYIHFANESQHVTCAKHRPVTIKTLCIDFACSLDVLGTYRRHSRCRYHRITHVSYQRSVLRQVRGRHWLSQDNSTWSSRITELQSSCIAELRM